MFYKCESVYTWLLQHLSTLTSFILPLVKNTYFDYYCPFFSGYLCIFFGDGFNIEFLFSKFLIDWLLKTCRWKVLGALPSVFPLPLPFCFPLIGVFSDWVGLISGSLYRSRPAHLICIHGQSTHLKSLFFFSIIANSLFNLLWYSLASEHSWLHVCFWIPVLS